MGWEEGKLGEANPIPSLLFIMQPCISGLMIYPLDILCELSRAVCSVKANLKITNLLSY